MPCGEKPGAKFGRRAPLCLHSCTMTPAEIRSLRQRAGLSGSEFGRLLGVSKTVVSFWERGQRAPTELQTVHLHRIRDSVTRWEAEPAVTWKHAALAAVSAGLLSLSYFLDRPPKP